ncbi:hypothetical protein [Deinococcus apachensis]|uniref:hypothetical protein n=1 Tax=Deinococcus apachensis TaxID=309886 RepID=UPI00037568F1|nr:hypothetical protein [Deinococcus apachensis]
MNLPARTSIFALTALLAAPALAQTRPTTPPTRVVQGTTQLAGDVGVIGKTYTIGKGTNAINFTLTGAEFSVSRVTVGNNVYAPKADEKLLILHYTVHNPQKVDKPYSWNSLTFTVVDAQDVNHVHDNYVGRDGTSNVLDITLKPAQKVGAYAVIAVPASGPVPKLIVSANDQQGVVRYDLRGKVKALAAPFADPADTTKVTALDAVPMKAGAYGPLGYFDVKLDSVAYANTVKGQPLGNGERALLASLSVRNGTAKTASPRGWNWDTFKISLRDAEGEATAYDDYLLKVSRDDNADGTLKPGEEARFRVYFKLPANVQGRSISVAEGESRALVFDVSHAR